MGEKSIWETATLCYMQANNTVDDTCHVVARLSGGSSKSWSWHVLSPFGGRTTSLVTPLTWLSELREIIRTSEPSDVGEWSRNGESRHKVYHRLLHVMQISKVLQYQSREPFFSLTFLRGGIAPGSSLGRAIHMEISSQDGAGVCGVHAANTNSGNFIGKPELRTCCGSP
jgi:hypothetical protein